MKQCPNWKSGDFDIKEMKRHFEAMSEQEKECKREAWRKRFHQKFAMHIQPWHFSSPIQEELPQQ
jgi:hypothetical protein